MAAATTFAKYPFLAELGLAAENPGTWNGQWIGSGDVIKSINPSTGETIAHVKGATKAEYEATVQAMLAAKKIWQDTPMPIRGNVVRDIGEALRLKKRALAELISLEMGKILVEAEGEVQEFIDVCELAVGLSRTINGNIFPSERAGHVIMEMWHPLGLVGIITAFNFPCAVYGWNISLSLVCGNCNLWKGASSTSLVTLATTRVVAEVLAKYKLPGAIAATVSGGGRDVGELLIQDKRLGLISFTGSTAIGTRISTAVHSRFGRTILELGGNNALIVLEDADLELALRSVTFAAVGTAGQRCTTVRRLVLHEKIYDEFVARLLQTYNRIRIGDPRDPASFVGPLHTAAAVRDYQQGIEKIKAQGGKVLHGGQKVDGPGFFVQPTLVAIDEHAHVLQEELFAPVLYLIKCKDVDHAIAINNGVPQGLSSSLFTRNMQHVFKWTSHAGSDCGIVNVNVPTNGAEIGGAFGGEKETGGGRESGSDSWKQYMRRSTVTLNYSNNMPLAQGISFEP